jgi:hypothetical protein
MSEVPTTYTLERLYHRVAELEADLRIVTGNIEYLERVFLGKRPSAALGEPKDNWKEIAQEVEADLFAEYLQNPPEERE